MAKHAERVLRLFGHPNPDHVVSFCGAEQEYFLIDRHFFLARPDLLNAGRTLFGAKPPKGQEFDDHYFGAIPERVLGFMMDTERELFKLGIPAKTRHQEVAPGQFEIAPMFERANQAADHQQLLMTTFKADCQQARPWSASSTRSPSKVSTVRASTSTSHSATRPRATCCCRATPPHDNAQFLVFCGAVIRAVHKYGGLLRASVASASNDHRLGANEAPPAIISIFLGDQLADVYDQIAKGGATSSKEKGTLLIGVDTLPVLPTDPGDRNRTSPFAFNRQPLRVPCAGLAAVCRWPDGHDQHDHGRGARLPGDRARDRRGGRHRLQRGRAERARRGHPEPRRDHLRRRRLLRRLAARGRVAGPAEPAHHDGRPARVDLREEAMELFQKYGVFSHREMHSRYEVGLEQYTRSIGVEARTTLEIGNTSVLPAAVRYQTEVALNISALKGAGVRGPTPPPLEEVSTPITALRGALTTLKTGLAEWTGSPFEEAKYAQDVLLPAMLAVRTAADELEGVVGGRPVAAADLSGDALHPLVDGWFHRH